ncbi:MAG: amylo-alpha-1,6-glucosidase [Gammaproteobacteria bacterium]|nr:amylo-alpha-1,6-glucosidase [Gammaproteobacteria bacterium]
MAVRKATPKKQTPPPDRGAPPLIRFGRETCGDLAQAERREWWLSNGRGGYAAGTLAHTLTRRYHGLLIAPVEPPLGRHLVLAKADATLIDGEREWPLFSNRWTGGAVAPAGHVHIESFHLDGRLPVWRYALGDVVIEQRIWMEHGRDATCVAWRLLGKPGRPLALRVSLLANARDHHHVMAAGGFAPNIRVEGTGLRVTHHDHFTLNLLPEGGTLEADATWIEGVDLPAEHERGLEDRDNHLRVGTLHIELKPGHWTGLTAVLDGEPAIALAESLAQARARDAALLQQARPALPDAPAWIDQLVLAADNFVFARPAKEAAADRSLFPSPPGRRWPAGPDEGDPNGESIIAGYPWFGDWGRDTMIALPGLALATGRFDTAKRILATFARFVDGGMLPNVFPGAGGTAEYNTVDAALWYVEAWRAYVEASGDDATLAEVFPVLAEIIDAHVHGTRYGIGVDPADGLLRAGEPGVQLTWMDAKVGDWVVTPRMGKPVEINALWYNALCCMADFAKQLGQNVKPYTALVKRTKAGFRRFVSADGGGLLDVLDGPHGDDASIRPNQILAVSLPHSPLTKKQQQAVVAVCARVLLTSYGLRSLSPGHPDYRPYYSGGVWERDGAYHQGTVWAWLLGHYALAEHRVTGDAALALSRLEPLADHLRDAGLGTVSEIFDADPPHHPRGAPAQAWSVACALEAWWRISALNGRK